MRILTALCLVALACTATRAAAEDDYESWTPLRSSFPSTGGNGIIIKGYDPVIVGNKCVTTFMAVTPDKQVYPNYIEFEAVPVAGGTLCQNGKWRAFDGDITGSVGSTPPATGTTGFRVFYKDGVFRGFPLEK